MKDNDWWNRSCGDWHTTDDPQEPGLYEVKQLQVSPYSGTSYIVGSGRTAHWKGAAWCMTGVVCWRPLPSGPDEVMGPDYPGPGQRNGLAGPPGPPDYYRLTIPTGYDDVPDIEIDVFDIAHAAGLTPPTAMALKYILRADKKGPATEDIEKAITCLRRHIELEEIDDDHTF